MTLSENRGCLSTGVCRVGCQPLTRVKASPGGAVQVQKVVKAHISKFKTCLFIMVQHNEEVLKREHLRSGGKSLKRD